MKYSAQQIGNTVQASYRSHQRQPKLLLASLSLGASALFGCSMDAGTDSDLSSQELQAAEHVPACVSKSSEVALFGDSYVNWISHTFPQDLNTLAHADYRDYAVGGYSMATGGIGFIPDELDTAFAEDPKILAAVVDGGGNDVLVPDLFQFPDGLDCTTQTNSPMIPDCQKIVELAVNKAVETLQRLADAGVTDVVYFFYPHVPEGTLVGGPHPNQILDYALPKAKAACDDALRSTDGKLACHFLDMIPVFDGHPEYYADSDIHPNPMGSAAMARAVWGLMQDQCIAQPASSGCCTPQQPATPGSPQAW